MIGALALAAAAAAMPVDAAERAFAAQAQREGQWSAFRATAAPAAVMFAPGMVRTHEALANATNPPMAVMWWPARTITACDGTLALSTGPWVRGGGRAQGTFTTIWQRQADGGWKWLYDSGRSTPAKVAAGVEAIRADARCGGDPPKPGEEPSGVPAKDLLVQYDDAMPSRDAPHALPGHNFLIGGRSADGTFLWRVDAIDRTAVTAAAEGAHMLRVWRWNGRAMVLAVLDIVGVPAP